jgi:hypothetical protein
MEQSVDFIGIEAAGASLNRRGRAHRTEDLVQIFDRGRYTRHANHTLLLMKG